MRAPIIRAIGIVLVILGVVAIVLMLIVLAMGLSAMVEYFNGLSQPAPHI